MEDVRRRPREAYSLSEGMERLGGISRTLMYHLIKTGQITTIKVGRRRLIPRSSLQEYIATRLREEEQA